MRSQRLGRVLTMMGVALLALPAAAQDEGRPERKRPDREGRGQRDQGRDPRAMMQSRGGQAPSMAVSEGKLFIVLGREIKRLDADTLEEEAKADIPVAGADDEANRKKQEAFIARFDKNEDGAITKDELKRPEMLSRFDKNEDGKITADEAPGPKMMAARMPPGPTTLLVEDGSVYVFQGGALYRFDADTLELEADVNLAPKRPERGGKEGDRKGGRGDKKNKKNKRDRDDAVDEPRIPDDPVRF
jgi:hypothetical protein